MQRCSDFTPANTTRDSINASRILLRVVYLGYTIGDVCTNIRTIEIISLAKFYKSQRFIRAIERAT